MGFCLHEVPRSRQSHRDRQQIEVAWERVRQLLFDFNLLQDLSSGGWKCADDGGGSHPVSVLEVTEWYPRKSTKMVNFVLYRFYHN